MNYTPKDCKEMTEKYRIEKGGICGQACLAVIEETTIKKILDNWKEMDIEFKGWSGWKQLREYLEKKGFTVKQKRITKKVQDFNYNYYYILRIQWIGEGEKQEKPYYGWNHWSEASAHTHFIVINKGKFFCNESGWFSDLEDYLKQTRGCITSYFEVVKEKLKCQ